MKNLFDILSVNILNCKTNMFFKLAIFVLAMMACVLADPGYLSYQQPIIKKELVPIVTKRIVPVISQKIVPVVQYKQVYSSYGGYGGYGISKVSYGGGYGGSRGGYGYHG